MNLWLDPIPEELRPDAIEAFEAGEMPLGLASNMESLVLVYMNAKALLDRGMYERALLDAFIAARTNNHHFPVNMLQWLFSRADRARLLAAGDPLPDGETFTLYRGVAGRGPARRVRGFSWTSSPERAQWFANRAGGWGLHDPAVYTVTVERSDVYAYSNERKESEFIVLLERENKPRRTA